MSPKVLWDIVRAAAARAGIDKLGSHDLRRTCAVSATLAGAGGGPGPTTGHVSGNQPSEQIGGQCALVSS
jgi:integrase